MKPSESIINYSLGIDISKKDFHAAILRHSDRKIIAEHTFANHPKGFQQHLKWLIKHCGKQAIIHGCLEATGTYGQALAEQLYDHLHQLSIVNPRAIKNFAAMQLRRDKSDKADARLIAHYCYNQQPAAWQAPAPIQKQTKALARRISQLKGDLIRENNRLEAATDKAIQADIKGQIRSLTKHIAKLTEQQRQLIQSNPQNQQSLTLLTSINGIGETSASQLLAELPDLENFTSARELAAYAGVTPKHFQSGTSGKTRTPMSKAGSSQLRKHLFLPAMSAMRHNPICREFAERLKAAGKRPIVIIGAIMNKLLHLIYGVLKHQKPFDPNYLKNHEKTA